MDYNNNGPEWRNDYQQQPGGQPPYPYPPANSQVVLREVGQQKENRLAITSLVLGIVTLIFFWVPFISVFTGHDFCLAGGENPPPIRRFR